MFHRSLCSLRFESLVLALALSLQSLLTTSLKWSRPSAVNRFTCNAIFLNRTFSLKQHSFLPVIHCMLHHGAHDVVALREYQWSCIVSKTEQVVDVFISHGLELVGSLCWRQLQILHTLHYTVTQLMQFAHTVQSLQCLRKSVCCLRNNYGQWWARQTNMHTLYAHISAVCGISADCLYTECHMAISHYWESLSLCLHWLSSSVWTSVNCHPCLL